MRSIIPRIPAPRTAPDVRPLAFVLNHTEPDLWRLILPGESWEDMLTRREAARDILSELLHEYGEEIGR